MNDQTKKAIEFLEDECVNTAMSLARVEGRPSMAGGALVQLLRDLRYESPEILAPRINRIGNLLLVDEATLGLHFLAKAKGWVKA